jgi:four helix bundle protein
LTLAAYRITANFPKEERYGLISQIRRCSASIAANIAEGCGRRGNAELHRFLQISAGSTSELEYHWLLARDLQFMSSEQYEQVNTATLEVRRMLASLLRRVDSDRHTAER